MFKLALFGNCIPLCLQDSWNDVGCGRTPGRGAASRPAVSLHFTLSMTPHCTDLHTRYLLTCSWVLETGLLATVAQRPVSLPEDSHSQVIIDVSIHFILLLLN